MKRILSNWREFLALLIAAGVFYFSGHWMQAIDPTAATFDLGVLQSAFYGAAKFFFGIFCVGVAMSIFFTAVDEFWEKKFDEDFLFLSRVQQVYVLIALFSVLLIAFVLCCKI